MAAMRAGLGQPGPTSSGRPAAPRLLGARLCSFLNRRLVFLHYRAGARAAALYVMEDEGLALPEGGNRRAGGRSVFAASHKGATTLVWRDGGLVYVVVSNLDEAEALAFAAVV